MGNGGDREEIGEIGRRRLGERRRSGGVDWGRLCGMNNLGNGEIRRRTILRRILGELGEGDWGIGKMWRRRWGDWEEEIQEWGRLRLGR